MMIRMWFIVEESQQVVFGVESPSNWEWIEDWKLNKTFFNTIDGCVYTPKLKIRHKWWLRRVVEDEENNEQFLKGKQVDVWKPYDGQWLNLITLL